MFFLTFKKKEDYRKRSFIICKGNACNTQVYIAHILKAGKPKQVLKNSVIFRLLYILLIAILRTLFSTWQS